MPCRTTEDTDVTASCSRNRYKSIICQEDAYLQELVRYIHLNPLRQKVVTDLKELEGYAYCGHSVLVGRKRRDWQDVQYVLGYFGKGSSEAHKPMVALAKKLGMTLVAVSYAVQGGEKIAKEGHYSLDGPDI